MNYKYHNIQIATRALLKESRGPLALARELDINNTHVYKARAGVYTPTWRETLQELGLIRTPEPRVRLAGDVPEGFREKFRAAAERADMTSGAYMQEVWESRAQLVEALTHRHGHCTGIVYQPGSHRNFVY
jgi:hypothetical protein